MDGSQTHSVLNGKADIYSRPDSQYWQVAAYLSGNNYRISSKQKFVSDAVFLCSRTVFQPARASQPWRINAAFRKKMSFAKVAKKFIEKQSD